MPPRRKKMQTVLLSKDMVILTKKYSQLNKVTGVTLIQDFDVLINKPETHTYGDWIISNAIEFLDRVEQLSNACSLFCTSETCPMFNAGPHYHYFWEDEGTEQPIQLSAPEYFLALKRWSKRNLQNVNLFPRKSSNDLLPESLLILKTIYRRTFRILAHLYMCHFSSIREFQFEPIINTILAHYTLFSLKYELIQPIDVEMLRPVYTALKISLPGLDEINDNE